MRVLAWLIVGAVSLISGGWSIPLGLALGLSAIEVYLAASIGSMLGLAFFLFAGDKLRARITRNREIPTPGPDSRTGRLINRHGARGLGLVGPLFPGVTASVLIGLAVDLDRKALARWMSVGIAAMFGLYTAGLWLLVEVVGID